jgi:hydrogenase expression/formation protein HypE
MAGRNSFDDKFITLSHGSGGKASHRLIEAVFKSALSNSVLDRGDDSAVLSVGDSQIAFTTDSYVIDPIFFPGGDIGRVAVNGTINDLATAGAEPLGLSLGVILEEGFPVSDLRRIVASMHEAARAAGTSIVTGDTKVVHRGKADKIFINTAGVGIVRCDPAPSMSRARPGDRVLLSGSIGDHGMTVLAARGELELELETRSDTAALNGLATSILNAVEKSPNEGTAAIRCLKDPTRGGVATALNEIAAQSQVGITIDETAVLIRPEVRGACEILGIDPLYVANEGKLLVVASRESSDRVLSAMHQHEFGSAAQIIGEVTDEPKGLVLLRTAIGGKRVVDMLVGDALPRIC